MKINPETSAEDMTLGTYTTPPSHRLILYPCKNDFLIEMHTTMWYLKSSQFSIDFLTKRPRFSGGNTEIQDPDSTVLQFDHYRYFAYPQSPGQKQYEALRSFYVDKLPARVVADTFGYTLASSNAVRQKFKTGKLSFQFTGKPGPQGPRVPKEIQERIFEIRHTHNVSAYRIAEILAIEGNEINPRQPTLP